MNINLLVNLWGKITRLLNLGNDLEILKILFLDINELCYSTSYENCYTFLNENALEDFLKQYSALKKALKI